MENLLVVVDMVNGFINEGALADKKIDKITPRVEELILRAKQKNMKIIAFKDCHTKDDIEFLSFPPHCIKGTEGWMLDKTIEPLSLGRRIFEKRYFEFTKY